MLFILQKTIAGFTVQKLHLLLFLSLCVSLVACQKDNDQPQKPTVDLAKLPYAKLTDYHFFAGELANFTPNEGVLPYDVSTALFSNYAEKLRFIYLPNGQAMTYEPNEVFNFPVGAILIKNFFYYNDFTNPNLGRRILETRLLIKTADGTWLPATYIWNDDQKEANFTVLHDYKTVNWVHTNGQQRSTNYYIPNKNDCKGCHSYNKQIVPIGPAARYLNKDFINQSGKNQLSTWASQGYLTGLPTNLAEVAQLPNAFNTAQAPLNIRARTYLDANCAYCHNPQGPANNTGLNLGYQITDSTALGICKTPVAAGKGTGNLKYAIVPGKPDSSFMAYRMNSLEIEIAMPELARSVVDEEGVALVREWIKNLPGFCD
ncbi:MAG: hypothetical protein IPI59_05345 [Sphingobacteriales bacterium]|jgi:uncharacterized repeat protein (TIGR03806 family)|nr:hypothetical protein [Sphingobacteriales bacterium]MBP9140817.1 hypothetical protein [Chitinophagales bacterium]MDA0198357.1 hypothetical protein [Bacteroidota bacterium]MBK6891201.1 hypothetical protein [Sphingobacteriales bacterium]MBK7526974.1 hypothetical protein [Sphingobacteriales bacterium]